MISTWIIIFIKSNRRQVWRLMYPVPGDKYNGQGPKARSHSIHISTDEVMYIKYFLYSVRLQDGDELNFGRLEILGAENNTWYPVCDDRGLDNSYSDIACKQLGYNSGQALCCSAVGSIYSMG